MIIEVVGKEIEKIKGDFESYLNGLNMVGEISYSQYSELYDEGTKQIQRAYELGKSELEQENAELKGEADSVLNNWCKGDDPCPHLKKRDEQLTKAKQFIRDFLSVAIDYIDKEDKNYSYIKEAEQFLKDCDIDNAIQQANKGLDFDKIADEMEQDLKESEVDK